MVNLRKFLIAGSLLTFSALLFVFVALAADGSGTNTVSPTTTTAGSTGGTYTFTYTATETMNSGGISITVPSGWSAPQGTSGVNGYTTISTTGVAGVVLDNADSLTGWQNNTSNPTACSGSFAVDTGVKQEGTGSIVCASSGDKNNGVWYKNITAQNWSSYTTVGVWIRVVTGINNGDLQFAYDDNNGLVSPIAAPSFGTAIPANTWTYVSFALTGTRTSIASYGFKIANCSALCNNTVYFDNILLGGTSGIVPQFSGNTITISAISLTAGQTITVTYGAGGGTSGVTAPSAGGVYTFTTKSRTSDSGTLTNISTSPTVTINNPVPTTTSISPTSKAVGSSEFTMTVNGTNFVSSSVVNFDGNARATTFVSATQITATIPASDLSTPGDYDITVTNPVPGGGTSNAQTFTVSSASNPVPTTTSISPTSKDVGDGEFTMTVNGTNFVSDSVVRYDGTAKATTFVSSTQLTATIPASDIDTVGTFDITVFNPTPGGGESGAQTFTVENPSPAISGISPESVTSGSGGFTLTVNGSGYISGSVVRFEGSDRATTFVNSGRLTATIPASDVAADGTFDITVFNPTPGGGTSGAVTFTVSDTPPPSDTTPPSAITNLSLSNETASSIKLTWTAPGDDGTTGTASSYDIRYSTTAIIDGNWASATQVTGEPGPAVAGTSQSMTVSGLSSTTTYHFAIKTSDNAGNESGLSNVPNATTLGTSSPPEPETEPPPSDTTPPPPSGGQGRATPSPPDEPALVVKFTGTGFPGGKLTVHSVPTGNISEGILVGEVLILSGNFSLDITEDIPGARASIYVLNMFDRNGNVGSPRIFINVKEGDIYNNIFFAPTLTLNRTQVRQGDLFIARGAAYSGAVVEVEIDGTLTGQWTTANVDGSYSILVGSINLSLAKHSLRVRQIFNGRTGEFSLTKLFTVSNILRPIIDFNDDGAINIIDINIFKTLWFSTNLDARARIDLNNDSKVDISDLSIFVQLLRKSR